MEIVDIVYIVVTLAGVGAAFFTNQKYKAAKDGILDVIGDVADLLAMVHAVARDGSCDAKTMTKIATKIEEVWLHIDALGPSFAALLASKSSLAKALSR